MVLDHSSMKEYNKLTILRLIKEQGPITRSKISELLSISRTTATILTNELCEAGLVREQGKAVSRGGRRPSLLVFNRDFANVIAIELGAAKVSIAVTNLAADIQLNSELPLSEYPDPERVVGLIAAEIKSMISEANIPEERILGLGVSVPGLVDFEKGMVKKALNLGWTDVPLRTLLQNYFRKPIRMMGKGEAGALGERWFGRGRTYKDFAFITLGTGIGAGLIINGSLYTGARDGAGEFGHITVDPSGPVCPCGNVGCLELYSSAKAIVRYALVGDSGNLPSSKSPKLTAKDVYEAAVAGDVTARRAFERAGRKLGEACVTLINLFNPEALIFGGGVAKAGDLILDPAREVISNRVIKSDTFQVEILRAELESMSGLVGAATLLVRELFSAESSRKLVAHSS